MPYTIRKSGSKFLILDERGKVVGKSTSRAKAEASVRARLAGEHGWKPKRRGK